MEFSEIKLHINSRKFEDHRKIHDLRTDFISLFELKGFVYHWNVFFVCRLKAVKAY